MLRLPLYAAITGILLFTGCNDKETQTKAPATKKSSIQNSEEAKEPTIAQKLEESAKDTVETVKEESSKAAQDVSDATTKAMESAKESTQVVAQKIEESKNELAQRLEKTAKESQDRLDQVAKDVKSTLPDPNQAQATTTPAKAKVCASCHGDNGEKVALGKSKIMNQLSKQEIIDALKGYQDGTYGGTMKAVMLGQVKSLSNKEIEELAEFYSAK